MIPQELEAGVVDNNHSNRRAQQHREQPQEKRETRSYSKRGPKPRTWRNFLRPRYIRFADNRIHVNTAYLSYASQATLSGCNPPIDSSAYVLQVSERTLYDAVYYKNQNHKGYTIDSQTQFKMFRDYFRNNVKPGLYVITAEIRNRPVLQILNALLMHAIQTTATKHCRWMPVYSVMHQDRDKSPVQDILVIDNIHEDMDSTKFTYLRDILYKHRNSVVILLIDGCDPLEFAMRYIHVNPRLVLNITHTRIPSYIRKI